MVFDMFDHNKLNGWNILLIIYVFALTILLSIASIMKGDITLFLPALFLLIFRMVGGILCYEYADKINYNINWAFFNGFMFGILFLPIYYAIYYWKKDNIVKEE